MRIARRMTVGIAAAGLALLAACGGTASVKEAETKVAAFHANLDKGDYDAVWKGSAEEITRGEGKAKLLGVLAAIHDHMGKVKASKQTGWKVNVNNGVHTTELTMQTTFEKGAMEENFLFRGTDQGLKLAGYRYEAK